MTVSEIRSLIEQLNNTDKQVLLDQIYDDYFRTASDEELFLNSLILQKYSDGELVERDGW